MDSISVHGIFLADAAAHGVFFILAVVNEIRIVDIFTIGNKFSRDIVVAFSGHEFMERFLSHCFSEIRQGFFEQGMGTKHFLFYFVEFFFGYRPVENVIIFIAQIITEKAILAVSAVIQKYRVDTTDTFLAEKYLIALSAVGRHKTQFTIPKKKAIPTVLTLKDRLTVSAIFRKPATEHKIAVFHMGRMIAIFTVYVSGRIRRRSGHHFQQLPELFEKRNVKIVVTAVIKGIPFVAPPAVMAVYWRWRFGFEHRDNIFFAQVAGSFV